MGRVRVLGAALAALLVSLTGAVAPQASAGTDSQAECLGIPRLCVWQGYDHSGAYGAWTDSARLPASLQKHVGSLWNRLPGSVSFYDENSYVVLCADQNDRFTHIDWASQGSRIVFFYYLAGWSCAGKPIGG